MMLTGPDFEKPAVGWHRIRGTTAELGISGPYPVLLYNRRTLVLVRQQWSNDVGYYVFNYIAYADRGYFVVLLDYGANPRNAVIADFVTPEPMP